MSRVLVLGGSRSGKSAYAESLFSDSDGVVYVATATARPDDDEWTRRVAAHRERRPGTWHTVETRDLAALLATGGPPLLVDSITTWVARTMDETGYWAEPPRRAVYAECAEQLGTLWAATPRHVVVVSDEVGSGIVPETESGRLFRDALGELNQRLAASADEVYLVVAGLPVRLK